MEKEDATGKQIDFPESAYKPFISLERSTTCRSRHEAAADYNSNRELLEARSS